MVAVYRFGGCCRSLTVSRSGRLRHVRSRCEAVVEVSGGGARALSGTGHEYVHVALPRKHPCLRGCRTAHALHPFAVRSVRFDRWKQRQNQRTGRSPIAATGKAVEAHLPDPRRGCRPEAVFRDCPRHGWRGTRLQGSIHAVSRKTASGRRRPAQRSGVALRPTKPKLLSLRGRPGRSGSARERRWRGRRRRRGRWRRPGWRPGHCR